ncbi:LacI family DNA-binding transcriptional regulator [Jannaschia seohaensis]|uniref:LacI family gluconate utilization system Gnt-I transcriptional repressor n=1 Tax=Jannaschia seohaensis TaxID=475081 RepID=A0A2Y9A6C4_9RHOB|nr:LacI family DNA-binding transcriptional regulator [Jannaschia seohaensis]PWJ21871.1 LacI family gluconate utilization system Gnt-I transcriptional repressor [Jannaschia seohaensis]SSA38149.1 LacI family transcriptional regulator, gluconate utilization system Gnt-I transcriptional repressor [Jannaschia seohaensis]
MTRRNQHLTLRDVSEASGVSEMTVSRVLRNRGDVAAKTREKVLEAARMLGYVPNKIAGALASNRVNLVAVVVPSLSNLVFPEMLAGVQEVLEDTELQPVIGATNYDPAKEEKTLFEMLSWRPSGVIVAGLEHTDASRAMLANCGVPVVEVMDVDGEPIDAAVGISHWRAGYQVGTEIAARGYERVAVLGTKMDGDHRARKRIEGLERALSEAGIPVVDQMAYSGWSGFAKGREMTAELLARAPDVDFLFYTNDLTGAGGLLYCLEKGLDVGGALGLAGFNAFSLLDGLPRRLATVDSRRREAGQVAARIITGDYVFDGEDRRVELVPTFLPGDTMRPPRNA